ncbi:MAG: RsmF rRNA methyltransferase first C-terminal domain-containing protein [Acetatifactor sp.]|nr:RsmF rRNA methyltransferase first C-terminal domain-containing protein [Acetatifactor sp.]
MLPEKFLERMQEMLGGEYEPFLRSLGEDRQQALRVNPLKRPEQAGQEGWAEELLSRSFNMTNVSWEKNGYYYAGTDQPGRHPYHEAGLYYIQEPSAMAVAPLVEVKPGEKILDLCAAPGGKSTQLAGYLQGEGLLVSNEIHPARARILSENIERMGVRNACVTNETPARLAEVFVEYFDRILVDAPCSGEGMFRKNETACEEWSPENVELCAGRQDEILDCAARMLRPGGRLVYSTCTFAPQENEGSVSRFLERHEEFNLLPIDKERMGVPAKVCDGRPEWGNGDEALRGTLRLWPHVICGEGHFAAVLQKEKGGNLPEGYDPISAGGLERGIAEKDRDLAPWWEFWRENGGEVLPFSGIFLRFGDNLYLAPEGMPALKGLKVLRPGLHLGTFKKNRFEPSHALALALSLADVRYVCRLSAQDEAVAAYLNGQTFPWEGEKGWYLITVDGCSIGWGKLAGGVMKNHYPRGLRKNG